MKTLLATLFLGFVYLSSAQNILLVDNTPSAPTGAHVYSSLQTAIDATVPGDIIHVKPSASDYGNITITEANDSISIYGIGINPDKEIQLSSSIATLYLRGNNIKISGMRITGSAYLAYSGSAANISMENNTFATSVYVTYSNYASSNYIFRNCIFWGNFYTDATYSNNVVVSNSIFAWTSATISSGQIQAFNGSLFSHCLFIGSGVTKYAFNDLSASTVSNCIFYGASPRPENTYSNATYNNCYAEQSHDDVFPSDAGNSVNGTIAAQAGPIFTDTNVVLSNGWNINWDPTLDPTGAAGLLGAGDDGTDVGLTGGTIPFSVNGAPLPYIKSLVVPSVIKQGNDLDVTIKANGN